MTNVDGGPFIILLGRMEMRMPSISNTSDLSASELLWMTRFLIRNIESHFFSCSGVTSPFSVDA